MGFRAWLRRQADRDDPVGDLSRDMIWEMTRKKKLRNSGPVEYFPAHPLNLPQVLAYLEQAGAGYPAQRAAAVAWLEYEQAIA